MGMGSMISSLEHVVVTQMAITLQVKAMLFMDQTLARQQHSTYQTSTAPMVLQSMALMQVTTAATPCLLRGM